MIDLALPPVERAGKRQVWQLVGRDRVDPHRSTRDYGRQTIAVGHS